MKWYKWKITTVLFYISLLAMQVGALTAGKSWKRLVNTGEIAQSKGMPAKVSKADFSLLPGNARAGEGQKKKKKRTVSLSDGVVLVALW